MDWCIGIEVYFSVARRCIWLHTSSRAPLVMERRYRAHVPATCASVLATAQRADDLYE
jgi:hypothetical protein